MKCSLYSSPILELRWWSRQWWLLSMGWLGWEEGHKLRWGTKMKWSIVLWFPNSYGRKMNGQVKRFLPLCRNSSRATLLMNIFGSLPSIWLMGCLLHFRKCSLMPREYRFASNLLSSFLVKMVTCLPWKSAVMILKYRSSLLRHGAHGMQKNTMPCWLTDIFWSLSKRSLYLC